MAKSLLLALLGAAYVQADSKSYRQNAGCTNDQLMRWYDSNAGLWISGSGSQYWWQSANMLSAFNDLALLDGNVKDSYSWVWENTYANAPANNPSPTLKRRADGSWEKVYTPPSSEEVERRKLAKRDDAGFANRFYDDEGWWGLAFIGALDNTGRSEYLDQAIAIWYDMKDGWNRHPCGGLPWNKDEGSIPVSISNEIYIQLGAALSNRVGSDQKDIYLSVAQDAWAWFQGAELINSDNLINDGIDESTCKNKGDPTYSYNQGVILGGLVELHRATGDTAYLDRAANIADAVTRSGSSMLDDQGILVDSCDRDRTCSGDGVQFKGVFARNLQRLVAVRPSDQWKGFLERNAQSIWTENLAVENGACLNGVFWGGEYETADASSQSSALDCLTAALAVTS